jgi:hypothetical protein
MVDQNCDGRMYKSVVSNLGYTYLRGDGKTCYGICKIEKKVISGYIILDLI